MTFLLSLFYLLFLDFSFYICEYFFLTAIVFKYIILMNLAAISNLINVLCIIYG